MKSAPDGADHRNGISPGPAARRHERFGSLFGPPWVSTPLAPGSTSRSIARNRPPDDQLFFVSPGNPPHSSDELRRYLRHGIVSGIMGRPQPGRTTRGPTRLSALHAAIRFPLRPCFVRIHATGWHRAPEQAVAKLDHRERFRIRGERESSNTTPELRPRPIAPRRTPPSRPIPCSHTRYRWRCR